MESLVNKIGVCIQGFIPLRKEPSEKSEMVSQVVFGEYLEVLEHTDRWIYIRLQIDAYEGWMDKKCFETVNKIEAIKYIVTSNNFVIKDLSKGYQFILPVGCLIPEIENGNFSLGNNMFHIDKTQNIVKPGSAKFTDTINNVINIPYLWGGRCGFGFDCSGLVQYLCRVRGKELPRDASDQSGIGNTLSFIDEVQEGDLAFFDNTEGNITHVGMIIAKNTIIHASGMVRIDKLDQQGIYNEKLGGYTHNLRILKRI